MSKFKMSEKDLGWAKILLNINDARKYVVRVGIQDDGKKNDEGTYIAEYAFYNEFGTDSIPERSFIRSNMDQKSKDYLKLKAGLWNAILEGKTKVKPALEILGVKVQADIQNNITAISEPPNAASTIAAKRSSNPLIDEGTMRRSIRYVVGKNRKNSIGVV